MQIYITYHRSISTNFYQILLLKAVVLLIVERGGRGAGWYAWFLRLRAGLYFILGIKPGAQVYELAPPGAKGKESCFFRFFLS